MIDKIINLVRAGFKTVTDPRRDNLSYPMANLLNLSFAMFSLKDASLSAFKEQFSVRAENLHRVYGVDILPGDTALRESIDEVNPKDLQKLFKPLLGFLRDKDVLKKRHVLGKYTVVSVDGTGHYCSGTKGCPQCMVKTHRNGKTSYYHQLLAAVAVHPEQSTVFPVACEAIVKQDGSTKNDCELNGSKRIIPQIRAVFGDAEQIITVFDALYINGPHIIALGAENLRYIIGTKGQTYVDVQVEQLRKNNDLQNVRELVAVARARWKIENETFNTLKNQGYQLEHNYGHGKKNLATNFAILTFLAFFTDQIAQHLDKDFQAAKTVCKTFKALWERIRSIFYLLPTMSMNAIYQFIIVRSQVNMPALE